MGGTHSSYGKQYEDEDGIRRDGADTAHAEHRVAMKWLRRWLLIMLLLACLVVVVLTIRSSGPTVNYTITPPSIYAPPAAGFGDLAKF
jgi:hypothetical protein